MKLRKTDFQGGKSALIVVMMKYPEMGNIKKWMNRFNGVATKYLANYMYWFKWLEIFNTEKDTIKSKNLLVQSHTSHTDKIKGF
jgi:amino acid permease